MESGKAPFCCTAFHYSPFQCGELNAEIRPSLFFFLPSNKEPKPYLAKCIIYKKPRIISPFGTLTFFHVIHDEEKMLITKQTWPKVRPALSKMIKVNKEMISVHRRSFKFSLTAETVTFQGLKSVFAFRQGCQRGIFILTYP